MSNQNALSVQFVTFAPLGDMQYRRCLCGIAMVSLHDIMYLLDHIDIDFKLQVADLNPACVADFLLNGGVFHLEFLI